MSYIAAKTEGAHNAPLFFTFHGTGGDESQFHGLAEELVPGARVISPRGDVPEAGMNRYFRRTAEGIYDMQDLAQRREAMANFISSEKSGVGTQRTIGLGYSNGANILIVVAIEYPELFDELVLMHPLIPWSPDPQPGLAKKKILITAGQQDPICPAPATEALAKYFTDQSAKLTLHWHAGGHEIRQDELQATLGFLRDPV